MDCSSDDEEGILTGIFEGGGGYGDPLLRAPAAVAADVQLGYVSTEVARTMYGVALGADGAVDDPGTAALRAEMRLETSGQE